MSNRNYELDTLREPPTINVPIADPNAVGHNNPMEPRQILSLGVLLLIVTVAASLLIWVASESRFSALIFGFFFLTTSFVALIPLISGDLSVLWDSWMRARVQLRWARVEEKRIDATVDIVELRSEVELETLRVQNMTQDILSEMRQMRVEMKTERPPNRQISANPERNQAQVAMQLWLKQTYTDDEARYPSGVLKHKLPWNGEWSSKPWREYAQKKLTGPAGPLRQLERGHNYEFRYPTLNEALASIEERNQ